MSVFDQISPLACVQMLLKSYKLFTDASFNYLILLQSNLLILHLINEPGFFIIIGIKV